MADYAIEGGRFLLACADLVTRDFRLSWYDRFPAEEQIAVGQASEGMQLSANVGGGSTPSQTAAVKASLVMRPPAAAVSVNKSNRIKYTCACGQNIWGKPGMRVLCELCSSSFQDLHEVSDRGDLQSQT